MPELPEVETTKTSLESLLHCQVQQVVVRNGHLRWPVPEDLQRLCGLRLTRLQRRSKYLIASFEQQHMLWHLGMSGSFRICQPQDALRKHDHLIFDFGDRQLRYHDPRRFGCLIWLSPESQRKLLDPLGPEPLSEDFHAAYLQHKLANKQVAIKVALMDNHIVVGVGNIYATESLFQCGIHPAQAANSLSLTQLQQLVLHIKSILTQAIALGGSSLRDYSNAMGENGYFQQTLLAYGRAGQMCIHCEQILENIRLGQRASVFCPQCQALKPIRTPQPKLRQPKP
jgi:formamidopyrimidine-DNA glycosylase